MHTTDSSEEHLRWIDDVSLEIVNRLELINQSINQSPNLLYSFFGSQSYFSVISTAEQTRSVVDIPKSEIGSTAVGDQHACIVGEFVVSIARGEHARVESHDALLPRLLRVQTDLTDERFAGGFHDSWWILQRRRSNAKTSPCLVHIWMKSGRGKVKFDRCLLDGQATADDRLHGVGEARLVGLGLAEHVRGLLDDVEALLGGGEHAVVRVEQGHGRVGSAGHAEQRRLLLEVDGERWGTG